jgi:hypothetical protein
MLARALACGLLPVTWTKYSRSELFGWDPEREWHSRHARH